MELAGQLDVPISGFLDLLDRRRSPTADLQLARLVDFAYTTSRKAAAAPIRAWLNRPAIGQRLEEACSRACDDATASRFAAPHDLWQTCTPGR